MSNSKHKPAEPGAVWAATFRDRMQAAGFRQLNVWVPAEDYPKVFKQLKELREKRERELAAKPGKPGGR